MKIYITIFLLLLLFLIFIIVLFPLDNYINKLPDDNSIKKFWKKYIIDKDPFD